MQFNMKQDKMAGFLDNAVCCFTATCKLPSIINKVNLRDSSWEEIMG